MTQVVVFVDSGYLFAQGSRLIAGEKVRRHGLSLNIDGTAAQIKSAAALLAPSARLLRIYWYDGLIRGGLHTVEQTALARTDDFKLRLGMVNSAGEQKGVDSLIVTDLIELARNRAISDAVVLAGDEDLRVGVQIAQTYGVRIHLIGIKPALGSQSPLLVAEADTHVEWQAAEVASCISVRSPEAPIISLNQPTAGSEIDEDGILARHVDDVMHRFAPQVGQLLAYLETNRDKLPPEIDRPSLARLRDELNRDLTPDERKIFRSRLVAAIRAEADRT